MNEPIDNQTADQHAEPKLPASLQPGGKLEQVLERSRGAVQLEESSRLLHHRVCSQVNSLRANRFGRSTGDPPEDALLRYCIYRNEGQQINEHLQRYAAQQYQYQADAYDLVLGDFIPPDFRKWARKGVARQAYVQNSHKTAAEDWSVFVEIQQRRNEGETDVLPTGIAKLDEMLGGLRGLTFVAGDKGLGKTSFVLQIVLNVLRAMSNVAVLIYSLDMGKTRIYERLLCCETGISYREFMASEKSDELKQRIEEANRRFLENIARRLRVVERDFSYERGDQRDDQARPPVRRGITNRIVLGHARELEKASGATQVLIVFDLFQKIDLRGDAGEGLARDQQRLDVLQQVQLYSSGPGRPHGYPILVISEIRKDSTRKEPHRDDLKGDGRIAGDADVVLLMWQPETEKPTGANVIPTMLRIDKSREGAVRGDLKLWFDHGCFRFYDTPPEAASNLVQRNKQKSPAKTAGRSMVDPLAE